LAKYEKAMRVLMDDSDDGLDFDSNYMDTVKKQFDSDSDDDFMSSGKDLYGSYHTKFSRDKQYNQKGISIIRVNGEEKKIVETNLGKPYVVIEKDDCDGIDKISTKEITSILSQDTLKARESITEYVKHGTAIAGAVSLMTDATGFIVAALL
jgi:hypothetical protein